MPARRHLPAALLLAATVASCFGGPPPVAPRPTAATSARPRAVVPPTANAGGVSGTIFGPAPAAIAAEAAQLISDHGGGVVSNNGAGLVANNGAGLTSKVKYALRAGEAAVPIAGAEVRILDAAGNVVSPVGVTTDAQGRFSVAKLANAGALLFVQASYTEGGVAVQLVAAVAAPKAVDTRDVRVDPGSTLVAKKVRTLLAAGAVGEADLAPAVLGKLAAEVAAAMGPKESVAAAVLPDAGASSAFDALVAERPALRTEIQALVADSPVVVIVPSPAPSASSAAPPSAAVPSAAPSAAASATPSVPSAPSPSPAASPSPASALRAGAIRAFAGTGATGGTGDGGPATAALLKTATDVLVGPDGSAYIADGLDERIRRVTPAGTIESFVGTGVRGFAGDGGPAAAAQFAGISALAFDPTGAMVIADDGNCRVRRIGPDGTITTIVGEGSRGSAGDGGPATAAQLNGVADVAYDAAGNLYVVENQGHRVRKVDPAGTITTFAGTGTGGDTGDGGPAAAARILAPTSLAIAADGTFYLAVHNKVRRIAPDGVITTIAGDGATIAPETVAPTGDGGPATAAKLNFPRGLALDAAGHLFVADCLANRVRWIDAAGIIRTYAGSGAKASDGDGGPAGDAAILTPGSLTFDTAGRLYVTELNGHKVRRIDKGP